MKGGQPFMGGKMKGGQPFMGGKKKSKRNGRSRRHCMRGGEGIEVEGAAGRDNAPGSFEFEDGVDSDFAGQAGNGLSAGAQLGAGLDAKVGHLSASAEGAAAVGAAAGADDGGSEGLITPTQKGGMRHRRRRSTKRKSPKRKSHRRKTAKRKSPKRKSPKRKSHKRSY